MKAVNWKSLLWKIWVCSPLRAECIVRMGFRLTIMGMEPLMTLHFSYNICPQGCRVLGSKCDHCRQGTMNNSWTNPRVWLRRTKAMVNLYFSALVWRSQGFGWMLIISLISLNPYSKALKTCSGCMSSLATASNFLSNE